MQLHLQQKKHSTVKKKFAINLVTPAVQNCKKTKTQKKYQVKLLMGRKTLQRNKSNRISLMPLSAFLYLTVHAHNAGYRGGEQSAYGLSRTIHIHLRENPVVCAIQLRRRIGANVFNHQIDLQLDFGL